jgi:ADP-ribosylglycohydrolase
LPEAVADADVFRLGAEAAALTHWHPDGYVPAGAMAVLVRNAMRGLAWEISIAQVVGLTRAWSRSAGTLAAMEAAAREANDGVASRDRVRRLR